MKSPALILAVALLPALWPLAAGAQAVAAPPAAAASSPPALKPLSKPVPKPMTAAQSSENAATPGNLRPEHPVTPQITIPLGSKSTTTPPTVSPGMPRAGTAAPSSGGINDSLARCMAMEDEQARAMCREKLAPPPGKGK